jgi:hypothetical protein
MTLYDFIPSLQSITMGAAAVVMGHLFSHQARKQRNVMREFAKDCRRERDQARAEEHRVKRLAERAEYHNPHRHGAHQCCPCVNDMLVEYVLPTLGKSPTIRNAEQLAAALVTKCIETPHTPLKPIALDEPGWSEDDQSYIDDLNDQGYAQPADGSDGTMDLRNMGGRSS